MLNRNKLTRLINSFLQKQESPEKLSENLEGFMDLKVVPLYEKARFTPKSASNFLITIESELNKCKDPVMSIKYLSLMSGAVDYFDKIFIENKM